MNELVVFYSPIKRAGLETPSGLRRVAGLFIEALKCAGFRVETPGLPLTYEPLGDARKQKQLREAAIQAGDAFAAAMRRKGERPAAWLTYHCYYKSPDVIGPAAATEFGCPYAIAEGSFARKRENGPWAEHHRAAVRALAAADILLAATHRDREGLDHVPGRRGAVVDFPPFIDCGPFGGSEPRPEQGRVRVLAAGSMTDVRKKESYLRLFDAVAQIDPASVAVTIAGDGIHRLELERSADGLRAKGTPVTFLGRVGHAAMPRFFASGDIFAWPGVGEAYGLTYLEAQAAGLPVVAGNFGGVPDVVHDGVSGLLVESGEQDGFARALEELVRNQARRRELGRSARTWVLAERSLPVAARRLRQRLESVRS